MYLIGLNGRLHSGKDTAFDNLVSLFGGRLVFQRVAFADKLKLSGMAALGLTQGTDEDTIALANRLKEAGTITVELPEFDAPHVITGREFWQWYGTEGHRHPFGDSFWVDALLPKPATGLPAAGLHYENQRFLKSAFPDVSVLVITDVRFPNEAERVIDLGGEVWYMDADERLGPLPEGSHVSEHGLDKKYIARTINCNGNEGRQAISLTDAFYRMELDRADAR